MSRLKVNGILLLYYLPLTANAPALLQHIASLSSPRRFRAWPVNTALVFPNGLLKLQFNIIVFHYSLFGNSPFSLDRRFMEYLLASQDSYSIAFFQDEYRYWTDRINFLNSLNVNCVYSLLHPHFFSSTYGKRTRVPKIIPTLTGYVGPDLSDLGARLAKPDQNRRLDVGYRGRMLPMTMGKRAFDKYVIAEGFKTRAAGLGLTLDIKVGDRHRLQGDNWYRFLANCKGVLGVESGVSVFDIDDVLEDLIKDVRRLRPRSSEEDIYKEVVAPLEDKIPYLGISPRHFEAAALRTCQILFEGSYQNILKPQVHYISLARDFSNFDEVIAQFRDSDFRHTLTENAHRDLVASGDYSYNRFIESFEGDLDQAGFSPHIDESSAKLATRCLDKGRFARQSMAKIKYLPFMLTPGRQTVLHWLTPLIVGLRRQQAGPNSINRVVK
jgi:hypothetical protein